MQSDVAIFVHRVFHGILAAPVDGIPNLIANDRAAVVVVQNNLPAERGSLLLFIVLHGCTGFGCAGILDLVRIGVCIIVMVVIVIFNRNRILPIL